MPTTTDLSTRPYRPRLPGADEAAHLIFRTLARIRRDRVFHPDGVVLTGTIRALGSVPGTPLLAEGVERRALVRISRAVGLPDALPDVLGCAIRVPDAYGPGAHQDLALASTPEAPLARHALVPAKDFLAAFYSSLLPYRLGGALNLLAARVRSDSASGCDRLDELEAAIAAGGTLTVALLRATLLGPFQPVATIHLDGLADADEAQRLRFNPWNTGDGIRPAGLLNALRDSAYRGSQAGSTRS
jgi:hypothetical protein